MQDDAAIQKWQEQIEGIKQGLCALGDMRPGSLSEQYNVCGNPSCRCKDKMNPRKHGPYYQLSYVHQGKSTTEFVRKDDVAQVRSQIETYRVFRELTKQWVELALKIAKARKGRG
jgi:hypothetical protein